MVANVKYDRTNGTDTQSVIIDETAYSTEQEYKDILNSYSESELRDYCHAIVPLYDEVFVGVSDELPTGWVTGSSTRNISAPEEDTFSITIGGTLWKSNI